MSLQASWRIYGGSAGTYEQDVMSACAADGFSTGSYNDRLLLWINYQLGVTYTSVPAALQAFATSRGATNWSSLQSLAITVADFTLANIGLFTHTRADAQTSATYFGSDGLLKTVAANVPRYDYGVYGSSTFYGLLLEPAATNVVLWSRDLTNAAWTKSNTTAAFNQTGIDGVTYSASSLTATAGNGTCLQAITLASSARWQSAFVKRLVGTGTINMTTDGGTTWTAIVPTATWSRLEIPTQTLANPSVGFRIVTSGDSIAVDYVQNETHGTYATSPIATTTAALTRATDSCTLATNTAALNFSATEGSLLSIGRSGVDTNWAAWHIDDGNTSNRIWLFQQGGGTALIQVDAAGVNQANFTSGKSAVGASRTTCAFAWKANSFAFAQDGVGPGTDTSGTVPAVTTIRLADVATTPLIKGWVEKMLYFPKRIPDAALLAWTNNPV